MIVRLAHKKILCFYFIDSTKNEFYNFNRCGALCNVVLCGGIATSVPSGPGDYFQGSSGYLRVVQVYIELSESYLFYIGKKKDKLLSWLFMKSTSDLHLNKNTEVGR